MWLGQQNRPSHGPALGVDTNADTNRYRISWYRMRTKRNADSSEPLKTLTFWDYMRRYGTIRNSRCISHNPEVGGSSPPSATIKTTGFVRNRWFFLGDVVLVFVGRFRGERRAWGGCCALRFCVYALNYKMRCAVCRLDDAWGGRCSQKVFPFPLFSRWHLHGKHGIILLREYNQLRI